MKRRSFLSAFRDSALLLTVARVTDTVMVDAPTAAKGPDTQRCLRLFLAGDVMTGRGVDQVLPHPVDPVLYESYVRDARDYVRIAERANGPINRPITEDYIWGAALDAWRSHAPHVRIVNLETSVTVSNDPWPGKGIHYRMHPRNVGCLSTAELDCCVLANNHVLDWGHAGLAETLATLHAAGIETAGAGLNSDEAARPARLHVPGKGDVLVFGVADKSSGVTHGWSAAERRAGVNLLPDLSRQTADRLAARITRVRQPGDVVVLSIHWGGNWGYEVPHAQRSFAHRLIDAGAVDVVHGHSAHHAKAIEFYGGKVILYGCGDLLNDYEGIGGHDEYRPWLSLMYFVTLDQRSRDVTHIEIEILRMRRFQLTRANVRDRRWLVGKLKESGDEFAACFDMSNDSLRASPCASLR